jgi:hypothetical protein
MRTTVLTLLALALIATPAHADGSDRCRSLAPPGAKVIHKGATAIVFRSGTAENRSLTYSACLYAKPRLYALPEQDGGHTELHGTFVTGGRYLAYVHLHSEPESIELPGWVEVVDLKRRTRVGKYRAVPKAFSSTATQILLRPTGAVAWIGEITGNAATSYSVQTARAGQRKAKEIDSDPRVHAHSLRLAPGGFSWVVEGTRMTAAFGGDHPR